MKSDFFMLGFLKDFVFGLIVFQSFTHDLPNDVISNTVYADCTTLLLMWFLVKFELAKLDLAKFLVVKHWV